MNGYKNFSDKQAKSKFTQNPQVEVHSSSINFKGVRHLKNISKLKKIAAKIMGTSEKKETVNDIFKITKFRRGKKVQERKFYINTDKIAVLNYENDGETLKRKLVHEANDLGQWVISKRASYKKGRETYRYVRNPDNTFERTFSFKDGSSLVRKGEILPDYKHIVKEKFWIYPPDDISKIRRDCARTDGVVINIKAKDLEKFKAQFNKASSLMAPEKRNIMIVENPTFETYRDQILQLPGKDWSPQNLVGRGFNVTYPKGDNDNDIIKVYILKSKDIINEYNERFTGKGGQKLTMKYKKDTYKMMKEFWADVSTKVKNLESITYKPTNPRKDKDYINQAEFLRLAATNEQDIDTFNALLRNFNIKTFEYKTKKAAPTK